MLLPERCRSLGNELCKTSLYISFKHTCSTLPKQYSRRPELQLRTLHFFIGTTPIILLYLIRKQGSFVRVIV